jgi:hypothetical protein
MDPRFLFPEHWSRLSLLLLYLFLFVGLVINTALSFLVAHGIIPSLVRNALATSETLPLRPILYGVFAISGLMAAFAFAQAIRLIVEVLGYFYPRFAI